MHGRMWFLVAGLLLTGSACAHRTPAVSGASEPQVADSVTVHIANHLADQIVVFARTGPHIYRMGYIDPGSERLFVLRFGWLFGRGAEFVAYPTYGEIQSGYLTLTSGDIVDWVIGLGPSRATLRLQ